MTLEEDNDVEGDAEAATEQPKDRLGRRLGRLKLLRESAKRDPGGAADLVIDTEMKLIWHAMIDVTPAELIEVVEDFATYVLEARQRIYGGSVPDPPKDVNGV